MSQELLYTSAPTGLKSGSRGFATVLCTAGMASNISTRLETLSGYRHVFSPQDPQASLNPVSWSHLRLTINGQATSILSRIAAYGVDYSGRTNKLAHHVVPTPVEMATAGPAWMLLQSSWVRTDWDGSCQTPASGPELPDGSQSVAVCQCWKQATGDAGWGGVAAESIANPVSKPLWIIFSIKQSASLLGLINESIALLPEAGRWRATFSTYYTNLPPEIDCKIRCVLAGTEEAKLAPARGTVIDLTKNLTPAPVSAYVETARTGVVMAKVIAPMPASLGGHPSSRAPSPLEVIDGDSLWSDEFSLQPPAVLGKPPGLALANKPSLPPQLPAGALSGEGDKGSRGRIGWAIGISALAIVLLLSAAIPVFLAMKKRTDGIVEVAANGTNAEQDKQPTNNGQPERKINFGQDEPATSANTSEADPGKSGTAPSQHVDTPTTAPTKAEVKPATTSEQKTTAPLENANSDADEKKSQASTGAVPSSESISDTKRDDAPPSGPASGSAPAPEASKTADDMKKKEEGIETDDQHQKELPEEVAVIGIVDTKAMFKNKALRASFGLSLKSDGLAFWRTATDQAAPLKIDDYHRFSESIKVQIEHGDVQLKFEANDRSHVINGSVSFVDFESNAFFADYIRWCNEMRSLHKNYSDIVDIYIEQYLAFSMPRRSERNLKILLNNFLNDFEDAKSKVESLKADVNKQKLRLPKPQESPAHDDFIARVDQFLTAANSNIDKQAAKLITASPEINIGELILYTNPQVAQSKPGTSIVLKLKLAVKE